MLQFPNNIDFGANNQGTNNLVPAPHGGDLVGFQDPSFGPNHGQMSKSR